MKKIQVDDVPSWIPLPVKHYLYAERAREQDEEKRKLEEQREIAMADCEKEALALWQQLGESLVNRHKVCSLEYYQGFVARMRNIAYESKLLYSINRNS